MTRQANNAGISVWQMCFPGLQAVIQGCFFIAGIQTQRACETEISVHAERAFSTISLFQLKLAPHNQRETE